MFNIIDHDATGKRVNSVKWFSHMYSHCSHISSLVLFYYRVLACVSKSRVFVYTLRKKPLVVSSVCHCEPCCTEPTKAVFVCTKTPSFSAAYASNILYMNFGNIMTMRARGRS